MKGKPTAPTRTPSKGLNELAADVRSARQDVLLHRLTPVNQENLVLAQRSLLLAMQDYVAELSACGLPVPRRLRDDLRLQTALRGHPR